MHSHLTLLGFPSTLVLLVAALSACSEQGEVPSGGEAGAGDRPGEAGANGIGGRPVTGGSGGTAGVTSAGSAGDAGTRATMGGQAGGGATAGGEAGEPGRGGASSAGRAGGGAGGAGAGSTGHAGSAGSGGAGPSGPLATPEAILFPSEYYDNAWFLRIRNEPISCDNREFIQTCFPDAVTYSVSLQIPDVLLAPGDVPFSSLINPGFTATGPHSGGEPGCWGGGGTASGTLRIVSVTDSALVFQLVDAQFFDFDINGLELTATRCAE